MRRPDRHNEVELNLLESGGSLTYLLGGRKVTVDGGRVTVFWAAIPHQVIAATSRSAYYVLTLPLAWFLQWELPERLVQPILHGQAVSDPRTARRAGDGDVLLFRRWQRDLRRPGPVEHQRATMLEIQARLLRLAAALPARMSSSKTPVPRAASLRNDGLTKAEQMACFVAQHYLEPLSVQEISDCVDLHPNYAMNLFKKVFATTLSDHLAQHRISHAQRLLATTDEQILKISLNSGFGSISRFNDVFRRSCGCSPREYRRQHQIAIL